MHPFSTPVNREGIHPTKNTWNSIIFGKNCPEIPPTLPTTLSSFNHEVPFVGGRTFSRFCCAPWLYTFLDSTRLLFPRVTAPPLACLLQVPMKSLDRSFMFNTGFQSCSAMGKNMECAVSVLTADPEFLKDLQNEVDGQASVLLLVLWLGLTVPATASGSS